jgi:hypothetical protein
VGKPDPNFRPNPERSIYISGKIDDTQVNRLAPQIIKLRHASSDPITVYINSNGGVTASADIIWGLLKSKDVDGNSPRIITVAVGNAKSAAADLLTMGDYAYACQHASILFHGSRIGAPENLTTEDCYFLGDSIGATNEAIALKLANASVQRLVIQYAWLKNDFDKLRAESKTPNAPDIDCFAKSLQLKTHSDWARKAVSESIKKCIRNDELSQFVFSKIKPTEGESAAAYDCKIFKMILNYELKENNRKNWKLDESGVSSVVDDYLLLRDYHLGGHTNKLSSMVKRFWRSFLNPEEIKLYEQQQTKPKEELDGWLFDIASPRIRPFWYLVVSMWRVLQTEDYAIGANDAYRLGAVDEIYGVRRPCYRMAAEEKIIDEKPISSTSEPVPPPAQSQPSDEKKETPP